MFQWPSRVSIDFFPLRSGPTREERHILPTTPIPRLQRFIPSVLPQTLLLDLDETLIHSSFQHKHREECDVTIKVEIEGLYHTVYVFKRPGVAPHQPHTLSGKQTHS